MIDRQDQKLGIESDSKIRHIQHARLLSSASTFGTNMSIFGEDEKV